MKLNNSKIKAGLAELADKEFQQRTWFSESGPEVSSFSELVCQLFDDTGLSDMIDSPELEKQLGRVVAEGLRELDRKLDDVDSSTEPSRLIESPAMEEVRRLARELLESLEDG